MCRSIKKLRRPEQPPAPEELEAAALQFVRKITGYRAPSRANAAALNQAVAEIARASRELFENLAAKETGR